MWNEKKDDPVYVAFFGIALDLLNRVYAKVDVSKRHWIWLGSESTNGTHCTPTIKLAGTPVGVRRALALAMGKHPGGASRLVAACRCSAHACVAPGCVSVTSRSHAIRKGISAMQPGQRADWEAVRIAASHRSQSTRLTASLVAEIRAAPKSVTNDALARKFNVSPSTISKARRGLTWASVPRKRLPAGPFQAMTIALTQC